MSKPAEIVNMEALHGKKGDYLQFTLKGLKGERKSLALDMGVAKNYAGPGTYEVSWKKEGEYFNITGIQKVSGGTTVLAAGGQHQVTQTLDPYAKQKFLAERAKVALNAATATVGFLLKDQDKKAPIAKIENTEDLGEAVLLFARVYFRELTNLENPAEVKSFDNENKTERHLPTEVLEEEPLGV